MTNSGKAGASTRRVVHGLRSATGAEGTLTAEENQRKRAKRRFKTFGTQGIGQRQITSLWAFYAACGM